MIKENLEAIALLKSLQADNREPNIDIILQKEQDSKEIISYST
jgi:hypothetical protein